MKPRNISATRNVERRHLRSTSSTCICRRHFGSDWFGRKAEMFARLFGTADLPDRSDGDRDRLDRRQRRLGGVPLDPYPFILLNLAFSLQVAYAAPLILLAQTRQADRDKALAIADAEHRDALARESLERQEGAVAQAEQLRVLLESNTKLTAQSAKLGEQVERLTREIHARVCVPEQA